MKKRFIEEQIHKILKESEARINTIEICMKYGTSKNTYYNWKANDSGMGLPDLKKMKIHEDENNKLKKIVSEHSLDIQVMKLVISKKL